MSHVFPPTAGHFPAWSPLRPPVSPEARRHEPEAAVPSDIVKEPFSFVPLPPSGHTFRMVDGVMAVFGPDDRQQQHNLFPVGVG